MSKVPSEIAEQVSNVIEFLIDHNIIKKDNMDSEYEKRSIGIDEFNVKYLRHFSLRNFIAFEVCTHAMELHETILEAPDFLEAAQFMQKNEEYRLAKDSRYKPIVMILKPRGSRKTSVLGARWHAWCYIRDAILNKKSSVTLVAHSVLKKAAKNLKEINTRAFSKELIKYLFNDVLEYERKTKDSLRFKDAVKIEGRKEDHFYLGSPDADLVGDHISRVWLDDWVTDKNSGSVEMNNKTKESFAALFSLDDHTGGDQSMPFVVTCTHYPDDSLYVDLKDNMYCAYFENGVTKDGTDFNPDTTILENLRYPQWLGMEKLSFYYNTMPRHKFRSQYDMHPYSRADTGINFEGKLPFWKWGTNMRPEHPPESEIAYKIVMCDPALSKKNKTSQAVVLVAYILNNSTIAVVDGWNQTGVRASALLKKITDYVTIYRANMAIIEAIGYQESLAQQVEEWRNANQYQLMVKRHRHFTNKQEHYRAFLEPFLMQNRIFVHPGMKELISQIYGKSNLDDMIDCLSFLNEVKIDAYSRNVSNVEPMIHPRSLEGIARMRKQNQKKSNNNTLGVLGW